jgi:hypothetical protein
MYVIFISGETKIKVLQKQFTHLRAFTGENQDSYSRNQQGKPQYTVGFCTSL